jgi:hypothetical protein
MTVRGPDFEEVKRQHAAFMANPAKVKEFAGFAMQYGFFVGIEQARIKGDIGAALFRHEYRRYFDMIHERVGEAEKETAHIGAVLKRMRATTNRGRNRMQLDRVSGAPDDAEFQRELLAFQGWIASLLETYLSMYMFVMGAQNATRKVGELDGALKGIVQRNVSLGQVKTGNSDMMKAMTEP